MSEEIFQKTLDDFAQIVPGHLASNHAAWKSKFACGKLYKYRCRWSAWVVTHFIRQPKLQTLPPFFIGKFQTLEVSSKIEPVSKMMCSYRVAPISVNLVPDNHSARKPISEMFKALAEANVCKQQQYSGWKMVEPIYSEQTYHDQNFLEIDLPGVEKEDISIELNNRRLVVIGKRFRNERRDGKDAVNVQATEDVGEATVAEQGEKSTVDETGARPEATSTENEEKELLEKNTSDEKDASKSHLGIKVHTYTYRRIFGFSQLVDMDAIAVDSYRNGVLRLQLPHVKKQEPRKIVIQ